MNVNVLAGLDRLHDFPDLGAVFPERVADDAVVPGEFMTQRNVLRDGMRDLLVLDQIATRAFGAAGDIDHRNRYIVGWIVN